MPNFWNKKQLFLATNVRQDMMTFPAFNIMSFFK